MKRRRIWRAVILAGYVSWFGCNGEYQLYCTASRATDEIVQGGDCDGGGDYFSDAGKHRLGDAGE